jgi:hypothetical protein
MSAAYAKNALLAYECEKDGLVILFVVGVVVGGEYGIGWDGYGSRIESR